MSLIVCLKAKDGIVLAADSRGTIGDPRGLTAITDTEIKIFQFGKCGLGIAGASEMGATLLDELKKKNIDKMESIDKGIKRVAETSATLFSAWFKDIPPEKRIGVLLTLAGYRYHKDKSNTEAMVYLLNSQQNFAPQLFGRTPCMSGVPQYAVYLVHRYYDPSISINKAKALAEYLINETASQDPKVGGPIRIATIDPVSGYKELPENEVKNITEDNAQLNLELRQFFMEGQRK